MAHTIEMRKVSKFYSNKGTVSTGFSRIDLDLDMGEFVVITGESGGGKSTLLNVISGLDSYEEGEMEVCGEDTSGFKPEDYERFRKTYIGNIFQDYNLVNSYTVYQNIEISMLLCGYKKAECKDKVDELIELVDLKDYRNTKASKLSGGQKQRVAIARALAKDAPIIVADEPTGNLDSESAKKVVETLYNISKDKLVVIVTHNYEQVEQYVTRKLTMHDGKIIEDKKYPDKRKPSAMQTEVEDESGDASEKAHRLGGRAERARIASFDSEEKTYGNITRSSQLRLGLRNTFNLPTKFILLLFVYIFITTSIISQYGSTKSALHSVDISGTNQYLSDISENRVILKKKDMTAFSSADLDKIRKTTNVKNVVVNDIGLDTPISLQTSEMSSQGPVSSASIIKESDLTYGRLPKNNNEVVMAVNQQTDTYEAVKAKGKSFIGKEYYIERDQGVKLIPNKVRIVGVILSDESDFSMTMMGNTAKYYVTDAFGRELATRMMPSLSEMTFNYNGIKQQANGAQVIPSDKVPSGKVYIPEDLSQYYTNGNALGKPFAITSKTVYREDSMKFNVDKVITKNNINSAVGFSKEDYEKYMSCAFVNTGDFNKLFYKGDYQISAFLKDEGKSSETVSALSKEGFSSFEVKNSLSDVTGGFGFVSKLFNMAGMIIMFIVLFFIGYAVIRLIMRSRNSYYSTLRILGANKSSTDNIMKIELITVMTIAYIIDLVVIILNRNGIVVLKEMTKVLNFLTVPDYIILFIGLTVMSILIANRYSRKIFSKSAMNVYRDEV